MRSIFCALITGAAAIQSTCTFTADNQVDKVLVDGVDVTALVVGVLTDWQSSKTLSFADSATDLTVCGSDLIAIDRSAGEFWCPDGDMTACAGFALSCSGGRWDGVATDTTWLVTARGTDPSALVPDANSETLAVASTSPFAWGAAGDKIWSAAADEAACFTKVIAPDLPNDWWVTHFAEGKIPSGHNKVPPEGYEPIDGAGECRCRGSGTNLDSCGDTVNGDPAAGEGTLCCDGSPYTNPNPGAAGLTSGANRFYIGDSTSGQICYKPIGPNSIPCAAPISNRHDCQHLNDEPSNQTCLEHIRTARSLLRPGSEAGTARICEMQLLPRTACQLTCCQQVMFANIFGCAMFLHIPKTGGSTIEKILDKSSHIFGQRDSFTEKFGSPWHLPPDVFEHKFHRPFGRSRRTFCIVRDPSERFNSEVNYRLKLHEQKSRFRKVFPLLTTAETESAAKILRLGRFSIPNRRDDILHLAPQSWFVWNDRGAVQCHCVVAIERLAQIIELRANPSTSKNGTLKFSHVSPSLAALYHQDELLHKRALQSSLCHQPGPLNAARQHRRESMPTVGGDDEAETEAEA
jgi:hypothetical protein